MARKPEGICDTCGGQFTLLWDGKVPTHPDPFRRRRYVCKGSKQPPEARVGP